MQDDTPGRIRPLLPEADSKNHAGGTHTHKPGCRCNPCKARARKQEALTLPAGDGGSALEAQPGPEADEPVLEADDLIILPVAKRSRRAKRALIADWIRLRTLDPEISNIEAAKKLGVAKQYLYKVINEGTKSGWLRFDDPLARVEHQLIPKVIDNLNHFLIEGDKTVTIEVAKGTIFKSYQEAKGLNQGSQTVLALKIELPPMGNNMQAEVVEGQIVGQPKVLMEALKVDIPSES